MLEGWGRHMWLVALPGCPAADTSTVVQVGEC